MGNSHDLLRKQVIGCGIKEIFILRLDILFFLQFVTYSTEQNDLSKKADTSNQHLR